MEYHGLSCYYQAFGSITKLHASKEFCALKCDILEDDCLGFVTEASFCRLIRDCSPQFLYDAPESTTYVKRRGKHGLMSYQIVSFK